MSEGLVCLLHWRVHAKLSLEIEFRSLLVADPVRALMPLHLRDVSRFNVAH